MQQLSLGTSLFVPSHPATEADVCARAMLLAPAARARPLKTNVAQAALESGEQKRWRSSLLAPDPAGVIAARRAAELGATTTLVTRDELGGTAANDGPVPVRTLAHAARLIREARQLGQYGIVVSEPMLDYSRRLARVREVVDDVRTHSLPRKDLDRLGVTVYERAVTVRFVDPHTLETDGGLRLYAERFILCRRYKPATVSSRLRADRYP
jgi:hypothetical protein